MVYHTTLGWSLFASGVVTLVLDRLAICSGSAELVHAACDEHRAPGEKRSWYRKDEQQCTDR